MRSVVWWMLAGGVVACGGRSHSESPAVNAAGSGGSTSADDACEPGSTRICRRDPPASIDDQLAPGGAVGDFAPSTGFEPAAGRAGSPSSGGTGNVAGAPVSGGSGNVPGVPSTADECYPPIDTELTEWVEVERTPEEELAAVRDHITKAWRGYVTTPWTPPYGVKVVFREDGTYGASCLHDSDVCCEAFYYGTDQDSDLKRYSIDDATLSGNVIGSIDIAFGADGSYGLPAWDGELSHVAIDGASWRLRFDFNTSDGYGPLHFELEADERIPSPK